MKWQILLLCCKILGFEVLYVAEINLNPHKFATQIIYELFCTLLCHPLALASWI